MPIREVARQHPYAARDDQFAAIDIENRPWYNGECKTSDIGYLVVYDAVVLRIYRHSLLTAGFPIPWPCQSIRARLLRPVPIMTVRILKDFARSSRLKL